MKHKANYNDEWRVEWETPKQCEDCVFRDKTTYNSKGKDIECGWHKSFCAVYPYPKIKPSEVRKNKGDCEYYAKDTRKK